MDVEGFRLLVSWKGFFWYSTLRNYQSGIKGLLRLSDKLYELKLEEKTVPSPI